MRKKWVAWVCIFLVLSSNIGFAGQPDPVSESIELDPKLQLLDSNKGEINNSSHYGAVDFLDNGNFVMSGSVESNLFLHQYNSNGDKIKELMTTNGRFSGAPSYVIQAGDGKLYTNDGVRLLQSETAMQEFVDRGESLITRGKFRDSGTEVGFADSFEPLRSIHFINYKDSGNLADFQKNVLVSMPKSQLWASIPEDYELCNLYGFDYGESEEELFLLVSAKYEMTYAFYILQVKKTFVTGEVTRIELSRKGWTKLALPENAFASDLVVTDRGFEVLGMSQRQEYLGNILYRFNFSGQLQDSVTVPGNIFFYDANGKQSAVVSWLGPDFTNALYLVDWSPASTGSPKSLIAERSRNGKTVARFRDSGYGLLKTKMDEAGLVDYLAPLKTEEKEVRLQIPLQDLLAKQGDLSRNLVILYGEDRIAIPMQQLDCSSLLAQLPCQDEATVELHLNRLEDGSVVVSGELFVVEQVDERTKRVHRVKIEF